MSGLGLVVDARVRQLTDVPVSVLSIGREVDKRSRLEVDSTSAILGNNRDDAAVFDRDATILKLFGLTSFDEVRPTLNLIPATLPADQAPEDDQDQTDHRPTDEAATQPRRRRCLGARPIGLLAIVPFGRPTILLFVGHGCADLVLKCQSIGDHRGAGITTPPASHRRYRSPTPVRPQTLRPRVAQKRAVRAQKGHCRQSSRGLESVDPCGGRSTRNQS